MRSFSLSGLMQVNKICSFLSRLSSLEIPMSNSWIGSEGARDWGQAGVSFTWGLATVQHGAEQSTELRTAQHKCEAGAHSMPGSGFLFWNGEYPCSLPGNHDAYCSSEIPGSTDNTLPGACSSTRVRSRRDGERERRR